MSATGSSPAKRAEAWQGLTKSGAVQLVGFALLWLSTWSMLAGWLSHVLFFVGAAAVIAGGLVFMRLLKQLFPPRK